MHLSTTKVWNPDMGRVRKLQTGIAFIALLVTAVMPSTAKAATGATPATGAATAVRASLRSELHHYLKAYLDDQFQGV
jgi:hypothetical protein